jgi:uncharacterized membrane protein
MNRTLRHLVTTRGALRRAFPASSLAAIESAIRAAESRHTGELRFAIESCLDFRRLVAGTSARDRAVGAFARLGMWDTAQRNGVLIYLLLADRDIEIVADRGFDGRVSAAEWEAVCRAMEAEFRAGRFEAGALAGIRGVSALVARHFPPGDAERNELPDTPVVFD